MIISQNLFYVILGVIALVIAAKPLYSRFVKKQGNKSDALYFLILLLLPINWYTPKIITVTDCGVYVQEVALFPTQRGSENISYGKRTYIFNQSDKTLVFEYLYYGDNTASEGEQDETIAPDQSVKVNTPHVDYIFETPAESVSTKSGGATKSYLSCE